MKEPMKIYDGSSGLQKEWTESKNGSGFHPLFTADARRSIVLDALKIWLLLGFIVGAVIGFVLSGVPGALFVGVLIAGIVYFGYRNDVYKKVYSPEHDRGRLDLPEGMSWEDAVERIRRGFANPDVEQVTDTPDSITFYSKKCGTYQLKNTAYGLKMTILTKPSKSSKKEYLYAVFSSVLLSQVIALLYPQKISAAQVEEEKTAVQKLFKAHKMPYLIEWGFVLVFIAFAGVLFYKTLYSDTALSKGISDSYYPSVFVSEATVGEVLDDFFADGKWSSYEQNGVTYVRYTGIGENTRTGEKVELCIYFELGKNDKTFRIDRMTWNGETVGLLQESDILDTLNDSYRKNHGLASSSATDSSSDALENALNDALDQALTDASSGEAEPESEAASVSVAESAPYTEAANTYDADDIFPAATRTDEQAIGMDGISTYWELTAEIMVDHNHYDELTESQREYYLSYGSYFRTAWMNAMYTEVDEYTGRYGNAAAIANFVRYLDFYNAVTDYEDTTDLMAEFYQVEYDFFDKYYTDTVTDSEAAPYVERALQIAEAHGAEWQGW